MRFLYAGFGVPRPAGLDLAAGSPRALQVHLKVDPTNGRRESETPVNCGRLAGRVNELYAVDFIGPALTTSANAALNFVISSVVPTVTRT